MKNTEKPDFERMPLAEIRQEYFNEGDVTSIANNVGKSYQYISQVVSGKVTVENRKSIKAKNLVRAIQEEIRSVGKSNWEYNQLGSLKAQKGLFNQDNFAKEAMRLFDGLDKDVNLMLLDFLQEKVGKSKNID